MLSLKLGDADVVLHAASPTDFFAEGADVRCQFDFSGAEREIRVAVGGDITKGTPMVRQ
ncbi:MAG TPA: hypothetical protein VHN79_12230 [Lacunisphaera sp.]|nr:hypothetical protein [Lacunisphaera sp.]